MEPPCPACLLRWYLANFLPKIANLLISASEAAGITDMYHHTQSSKLFNLLRISLLFNNSEIVKDILRKRTKVMKFQILQHKSYSKIYKAFLIV
jgi:hypothetical protein